MRTLTPADRRARLVRRHHLVAAGADGPAVRAVVDVARDLVGFHASDPLSVFLQARARIPGLVAADLEQALYRDRTVARVLGMRRTMFVVPAGDLPMLRAAVTDGLAGRERRRTARLVEDAGIAGDGEAWVRRAGEATLAALDEHGPTTAVDLRELVPALAEQVTHSVGTSYEGTVGMSTRVLFWLATTGRIVRAEPQGTIKSSRYRWARTEQWLPDGAGTDMDPAQAEAALARRYLATYGPVTFDDLAWWTGWTRTRTRRALAAIEPTTVDLGGDEGLVLPGDDARDAPPDGPRVVLLPSLDATAMGFTRRDFYLGVHTTFPGPLFDRNGNVGPTVWVDGLVVGGWGQRGDGEVAWRLLEGVGPDVEALVADEADALRRWLGEVRVVPRFRTALERDLSA